MDSFKSIHNLQRYWNKAKEKKFFLACLFIGGFLLHSVFFQEKWVRVPTEEVINIKSPSEEDIRIGDVDAAYKILIYTDYECPFCRDVDERIPSWIHEFGTTTVSFYLRHLPLTSIHPRALEFASNVECVKRLHGNELAFEFGKFTFDNLSVPMEEILSMYALQRKDVIPGNIKQCSESEEAVTFIEGHAYEALLNGLRGTPSFVIFDSSKNEYIYKRAGGGAGPYTSFFRSFFSEKLSE